MMNLSHCMLGELHNNSSVWAYDEGGCIKCREIGHDYLLDYKGEFEINRALDHIVDHFKKCHPVPELKLSIEVTV